MSRHFCCCIPVRVAVFIASLTAFLLSGAVSGLAIYLIIRINDPQAGLSLVTTKEKTAIEVAAGIFAFVCLSSLFGFIGSVIRNRGLVAIYVYVSYLILFLELISVTYGSVSLFVKVPGSEESCNVEVGGQPANCLQLSTGLKVAVIGLAIIVLLIQFYVVVVIRRYLQQLEEEQSYNRTSKYAMGTIPVAGAPTSTYYPHTPMQNQAGGYSYATPQHSFGNNA